MKSIIQYLKEPRFIGIAILRITAPLFPDQLYLRLLFRLHMQQKLNLKNPITFNEKLQWLKIHNRKPIHTTMVDKQAAKDYVASLIGEEYVIPSLGVWDNAKDIDFSVLPNQFVLKTTHSGGNTGVVICTDINSFNKENAIKRLNKSLKSCCYYAKREWPYKNVSPRIIAEPYLHDDSPTNKGGLSDYKFSCFNGIADNVMVCSERHTGNVKYYFFDKDWNLLRLNVRGKECPQGFSLPKPSLIEKMFEIAETLSHNNPYLRVDLYYVHNRIYFGELTFFPCSGLDNNLLKETDLLFGSKIRLQ